MRERKFDQMVLVTWPKWSRSNLHLNVIKREHFWKVEVDAPWNRCKPSSKISLLTVPKRYFFCGSFVWFMPCICHAFTSVHSCLVVTWRERADLLDLVCDVYCDFVTFPFGILRQVWYLIVSIPDPCSVLSFILCSSPELKASG